MYTKIHPPKLVAWDMKCQGLGALEKDYTELREQPPSGFGAS